MKKLIIIFLLLTGLISCEPDDNFYDVAKIIKAPNEIEINKPFSFNLILINRTKSALQLTLDNNITKSVHFKPNWYCENNLIFHKTPNPKELEHDYYTVFLKPTDSLIFELKAELQTYSNNDSLMLTIENYQKDFRLYNHDCNNFILKLAGMWIPGKSSFLDAMEGYYFITDIKINKRQQTNKPH